MNLTKEQTDVLLEVCNIGMSKAAKQLSVLLNGPVFLNNPTIESLGKQEFIEYQLAQDNSLMSMVHQKLDRDFDGHAVLVFKRDYTARLLEAVVGEIPNLNAEEIRSCEQEAMLEIGNIVISSCVTAMANMLSKKVGLTVPNYYEGTLKAILSKDNPLLTDHLSSVFLLSTVMSTEKGNFSGRLMMFVSLDSINAILKAVNKMLGIK
jgi:chemotaxis protein CheC|tara:strand:- start:45152 stop:45772 length:621 start_codon:yes stop_codon:yes gene_type:complete